MDNLENQTGVWNSFVCCVRSVSKNNQAGDHHSMQVGECNSSLQPSDALGYTSGMDREAMRSRRPLPKSRSLPDARQATSNDTSRGRVRSFLQPRGRVAGSASREPRGLGLRHCGAPKKSCHWELPLSSLHCAMKDLKQGASKDLAGCPWPILWTRPADQGIGPFQ